MSAREKTPFGQFELHRSHLKTERPGAKFRYDLLRGGEQVAWHDEVSDPEKRRAALTVVEQTDGDLEFTSDVLEMLGLKDYTPGKPPSR